MLISKTILNFSNIPKLSGGEKRQTIKEILTNITNIKKQ